MMDKEELLVDRLITAWGIFRVSNPYEICKGREFQALKEPEYCMGQMLRDTDFELKYRLPIKPRWDNGRAYCWKCGEKFPKKHQTKRKFCSYCGQAVKWND